MDNEIFVIILVVLVPAALMWAIFLMRSSRARRTRSLGIPAAMRPGDPDEVLEGPRLERIQVAGVIATVATAVFIAVYWLPESDRYEHFEERFVEESLLRGQLIARVAEQIPEGADPQVFKEKEKAQALGMGCELCHGGVREDDPDTPEDESELSLAGGQVPNGWNDPSTKELVSYNAPPLQDVFQRWDEEVIRFTIERGRPGTPMPTWGIEYGGPMTEQMVDDVIAYLKSLPGNQQPPEELSEDCQDPAKADYMTCGQEIFETRCAVCHGLDGQGKEAKGLIDDPQTEEEEPTEDPWYQGAALWKGDVRHLNKDLHYKTIYEGRRFQFMPAWGEAPPQGIPVPPYPLTNSQIKAVMEYERKL